MSRPREGDDQQTESWFPSNRRRLLFVGVGVLVVVAIALAHVGAFVSCIDCNRPESPPVRFDSELDPGADGWATGDETVVFTHAGGDGVDPARLELWVDVDGADDESVSGVSWPTGERWTSGEKATHTGTIPANTTVQLIWHSPDDDISQVLDEVESEGPTTTASPSNVSTAVDAGAFAGHRSSSVQSHSLTASVRRSCATRVDTFAGWPPR